MAPKKIKLTWKCGKCGDIVESYSFKRWDMDVCKCGESGIDLEDWYQRNFGCPVEIKREEIKD